MCKGYFGVQMRYTEMFLILQDIALPSGYWYKNEN